MMEIYNDDLQYMIMTPRQVCNYAEKNDGNNVVSCFSSVGRPSQRVADAQKSRMVMLMLVIVLGIVMVAMLIADIYISISTGTFDIENIKYEKKLATVRFRYIL